MVKEIPVEKVVTRVVEVVKEVPIEKVVIKEVEKEVPVKTTKFVYVPFYSDDPDEREALRGNIEKEIDALNKGSNDE